LPERRYTPEESSRFHDLRHSSYSIGRKRQEEAARKETDLDLHQQLAKYVDKSDEWFSRRTLARVKRRVYIQEALRRGLILPKGVSK